MFTITCPHCNEPIIITKINCGIFRHGVIIKTGKQINPHMKQSKCEILIKKNAIYGCGKQFSILQNNNKYETSPIQKN